jgi:hypothetical protein
MDACLQYFSKRKRFVTGVAMASAMTEVAITLINIIGSVYDNMMLERAHTKLMLNAETAQPQFEKKTAGGST